MFIHLVSLTKGAMRMVVVSQLDRDSVMRGIITTRNKQRATFVPVAAPIVYASQTDFKSESLGHIGRDHGNYATYKSMLDETVEQGYARLVQP